MNEEEKKAIESLRKNRGVSFALADIISNLIDKQEKEIEELKEKEQLVEDSISKDKIKKILGIEENIEEEKILSLLQTIVDECNRLEDIEDRKVQVEYQNVFNKGVKSVEDKIRAKIKELEEVKEKYFEKQIIQGRIDLLKELLEE